MKISNETKVGILAIAAITVLILGFNFLKGNTIFKNSDTIYAKFTNIASLDKSNPVKINGLPVGTVYEMKASDREVNSIVVTIHLSENIAIPKNSVAYIDAALVGSSYITIEKGDSKDYLEVGDTISTKMNAGIIGDIKSQLTPTILRVNDAVDSLTMVLGSINAIFDPATNNNLQTVIANLAVASFDLQKLLNAQTGALAKTLTNLEQVTGNMAQSNAKVTATLQNLETTSTKLANARIEETIAVLEGTINELKTAVNKIHSNDGSLGKLLNDKELYDNLNGTAVRMQILLDDLRLNPKRYVNFSLIGRKDKNGPITSPAAIDTSRSGN